MVGEKIKYRRVELGLTQDELCKKAGISKSFLSEIENGKKSISAETLLNIAEALNVSLDFLMKGISHTIKQTANIEIPQKLVELASKERISFRQTLTLLEMKQQIIAHRSANNKKNDDFDWAKFYMSVKEFLKD